MERKPSSGQSSRDKKTIHNPQPFKYYCVLDFEATCEDPKPDGYEHEIIEFPIVLVEAATLEVKDTIQIYVKPKNKPKLSEFCTRLTGITQAQVDGGVVLSEALYKIHKWLREQKVVEGVYDSHIMPSNKVLKERGSFKYPFVFVTDGPWDLGKFLHQECVREKIRKPRYYDQWVNLRYLFCDFNDIRRANIQKMLDFYDMEFEGSPHSGLDDSMNIARIAVMMAKAGCRLDINDGVVWRKLRNRRHSSGSSRRGTRNNKKINNKNKSGDQNYRDSDSNSVSPRPDRKSSGGRDYKANEPKMTKERCKNEIKVMEGKLAKLKGNGGAKLKRKKDLRKQLKHLRGALNRFDTPPKASDSALPPDVEAMLRDL
ncbi:hypothetical protein AAMO2058_000371500 [Amorphochlora amoebiformis]